MTSRRLAAWLLMGAALTGCVTARSAKPPEESCLPEGRNAILARVNDEENRPTAEEAAELLVNALRDSAHVVGMREILTEATTGGLGPWTSGVLARLQRGGRLTLEEGRSLWEQFGITTLIATDLTEYEQVWGKYAKFTRARLDAQAFDLTGNRILWRMRGDSEVEDSRGRSFRIAMEQAVQQLADSICPTQHFSLINAWRYFRR